MQDGFWVEGQYACPSEFLFRKWRCTFYSWKDRRWAWFLHAFHWNGCSPYWKVCFQKIPSQEFPVNRISQYLILCFVCLKIRVGCDLVEYWRHFFFCKALHGRKSRLLSHIFHNIESACQLIEHQRRHARNEKPFKNSFTVSYLQSLIETSHKTASRKNPFGKSFSVQRNQIIYKIIIFINQYIDFVISFLQHGSETGVHLTVRHLCLGWNHYRQYMCLQEKSPYKNSAQNRYNFLLYW